MSGAEGMKRHCSVDRPLSSAVTRTHSAAGIAIPRGFCSVWLLGCPRCLFRLLGAAAPVLAATFLFMEPQVRAQGEAGPHVHLADLLYTRAQVTEAWSQQ